MSTKWAKTQEIPNAEQKLNIYYNQKIKNTNLTINSNEPQSGFCLIFFCYSLHFALEMMWQQNYFSKAAVHRSISTFSWETSVFHNIKEEHCGCDFILLLLIRHHSSTEMLRCLSEGSHSRHKTWLSATMQACRCLKLDTNSFWSSSTGLLTLIWK